MPEENVIPHPLIRDGKSQAERRDISALTPESLPLDHRSEQQLLAYLYEYAKSVTYYDTDMQTSNWQAFLLGGVAVQASIVSQFDPQILRGSFEQKQKNFSEGLNKSDLGSVLDFLFETAFQINHWHIALANDTALVDGNLVINENDLRRVIGNLIASNLRQNVVKLVAVANVWSDKSIVNERRTYEIPDLGDLSNNDVWGNLDYATLSARDAVLKKKQYRPDDFAQAAQAKLNEVFQTFHKAINEIVAAATTIDVTPPTQTHDPHLALLYAFLRLFKFVGDDMNRMTKRHLDFYYRDVLGLTFKAHVPDVAHLIFEINKPYSQHKINAETLVKDGKDALGSDILFNLTDEVIVDKAQVKSLRTIFKSKKLHAAPVADSADGLGAAFNDPTETRWKTLGKADDSLMARVGLMVASPVLFLSEGTRTITTTFTTDLPINFNIVSHLFSFEINDDTLNFLKANKLDATKLSKKVYVGDVANVLTQLKADLQYPIAVSESDLIKNLTKTAIFKVELTGKKGWFQPKGALTFGSKTIAVTLGAAEEAVVGADPSVLKADFGTTDPMMRLTLNPYILNANDGLYNFFKKYQLTNISIIADVKDVKTMIVKTDEGIVDATKPFMPFGAVPGIGSSFTVLTPSLSQVKLSKLDIKVEWDKLPTDEFVKHYEAYAKSSYNPNFPNVTPTITSIITKNSDFKVKVNSATAEPLFTKDIIDDTLLSKKSFSLGNPNSSVSSVLFELSPLNFLHSLYTQILVLRALEKDQINIKIANATVAVVTAATTAGVEQGKINNVLNILSNGFLSKEQKVDAILALNPNLNSTAQQNLITQINAISNRLADASLNVLTPNPPYTPIIKAISMDYTATTEGVVKLWHLHPFEEQNVEKIALNDKLLPQFDDEGSLLIGLTDAVMGSTVRLLFQVLEPSADAYLSKADIKWQVLNGNKWDILKDGEHILDDDTQGLIRSGVVQINLPFGLNRLATTLLPPQYIWLKASATQLTAAVCDTIGVFTQAAKTVFKANKNDLSRLKVPLKAGALAKLAEPDSFIKGVKQPFESIGGRAPEDDTTFYRRVSERLRHKGRAITLFDYEQLVLEAFTDIYKVKCITHTLASRTQGFSDKQAAAGHVTFVVIPNVSNLPFTERLKPKASRRLLEAVHDFLKERISPFVRLRVMNPVYDEIHIAIDVIYKQGKSPEFYNAQLRQDLERYFAPWAYAPDAPMPFSGVVFKSSIIGFVESLDYVDYIKNFNMKKNDDLVADEITPSSARAILVSGNHQINVENRTPLLLARTALRRSPPVG